MWGGGYHYLLWIGALGPHRAVGFGEIVRGFFLRGSGKNSGALAKNRCLTFIEWVLLMMSDCTTPV